MRWHHETGALSDLTDKFLFSQLNFLNLYTMRNNCNCDNHTEIVNLLLLFNALFLKILSVFIA